MKKFFFFLICYAFIASGCVVEKNFNVTALMGEKNITVDFKGEYIDLKSFAHRKDSPKEKRLKHTQRLDKTIRNEVERRGGSYTSTLQPDGIINAEFSVTAPYPIRKRNDFGNVFKIINEGNGIYTFQHHKMKAKHITDMKKIGINTSDLSGTVCFKVTEGVKVLEENADSKPGLFSSCYKWELEYGKNEDLLFKISVPVQKSKSDYDPMESSKVMTKRARAAGVDPYSDSDEDIANMFRRDKKK